MCQVVGVDERVTQRVFVPQFENPPALGVKDSRNNLDGASVVVNALTNLPRASAVGQETTKEYLDVWMILRWVTVSRVYKTCHLRDALKTEVKRNSEKCEAYLFRSLVHP